MVSAVFDLFRAKLALLVMCTTAAGFMLASAGAVAWSGFTWTLAGTTLAALGASGLNQWVERDRDALMDRTRHRPLPAGNLSPARALIFSGALSLSGLVLLALKVNRLAAGLALTALLVYLAIYTPLKSRSPFCTLIGSVTGGIAPLIGWAGAAGELSYGAWFPAVTVLIWQTPHSLALAWLQRHDLARAGFRILPAMDRSGETTVRVIMLSILTLLPLGLASSLMGLTGLVYAIGSLSLGVGLLAAGYPLFRRRVDLGARRLFIASLVYLPLILLLMVTDRGPLVR